MIIFYETFQEKNRFEQKNYHYEFPSANCPKEFSALKEIMFIYFRYYYYLAWHGMAGAPNKVIKRYTSISLYQRNEST